MPTKYKLSPEAIQWIIITGYEQYTITELCKITGNVVTFASMWALLRKHNKKAITVYQRAEQTILKLSQQRRLKSIQQAARITGYNYHLISKIIEKHKLPITSKRANNVIKNRWHKQPYKRVRANAKPTKTAEFELKKQQVIAMLNKTRAKW